MALTSNGISATSVAKATLIGLSFIVMAGMTSSQSKRVCNENQSNCSREQSDDLARDLHSKDPQPEKNEAK